MTKHRQGVTRHSARRPGDAYLFTRRLMARLFALGLLLDLGCAERDVCEAYIDRSVECNPGLAPTRDIVLDLCRKELSRFSQARQLKDACLQKSTCDDFKDCNAETVRKMYESEDPSPP